MQKNIRNNTSLPLVFSTVKLSFSYVLVARENEFSLLENQKSYLK